MKKISAVLVLASAVLFAPLFAGAYYGGTVTAPYWCGAYWSSYPCVQQYQAQYVNYSPYSYSPSYPYNYNYNYNYYQNAPSQPTGYWTYCYETVAPTHGYSYRYPCYQQYNQNYQYYYHTYPYDVGVGYPYYRW